MRNNKTTKGNKRPIKKLIALWVVFAMLVVPFASYVGEKEGARAASDVQVISDAQTYTQMVNLTITAENGSPAIQNGHVDITLLKSAQKFQFKYESLTDPTNITPLTIGYIEYSSLDDPAEELDDSTSCTEINVNEIIPISDTTSDKTIAIYAYNDGTSKRLQYVIKVNRVDAFTTNDGIYPATDSTDPFGDGTYTASAYLKAGSTDVDSVATASLKYYVGTTDLTTDDQKKAVATYDKTSNTFSKDEALLCNRTVYAYAAVISDNNTPDNSADDVVLAYEKLGSVHISNDTTAPTIAVQKQEYQISSDSWHDGFESQYTQSGADFATYYGNSENYRFTLKIEDLAGTNEEASGIQSVTATCNGVSISNPVPSDYNDGIYTITVPKADANGYPIIVTAKDKIGKTTTQTLTAIKQVTPGITFDEVTFDGSAWGGSTDAITKDQKTITVKYTATAETVQYANLSYGGYTDEETIWSTSNDPEGQQENVDRTRTYIAKFSVPVDTSTSKTFTGLKVNVKASAAIPYTKSVGKVIFDKDAPVVTLKYIQKSTDSGVTWPDVTDVTNANNIAPTGEDDIITEFGCSYRYVVEVSDSGDSGIDVVQYFYNSVWTDMAPLSGSDNLYTCDVPDVLLDKDIPYVISVGANDKAGNPAEIKTFRGIRKIDDGINIESVKVVNSNNVDVTADVANGTAKTNTQYKMIVQASSAYQITNVKLYGAGITGGQSPDEAIENSAQDANTHRYSATVEFTLPIDTNVNVLLQNMYLEVDDGNNPTKRYPDDSTLYIGNILYDRTEPVLTPDASLDTEKWYKEYSYAYSISSGAEVVDGVESDLASASYRLNYGVNTTGEAQALPVSGKTSAGQIAIPQSTGIDGTLLAFEAQDVCENRLPVNGCRIKVDGEEPKITLFDVNKKTILSEALKGTVSIRANVSDNLTIASATMQIVGPDGINVTKELCTAGDRVDIGQNNSFTLDEFLGKKAPDGNYTVTVRVSDKAGNAASDRTITFTVDNTIPVVTAKIAGGTTAGKQPGRNFDGSVCDYFYSSNVPVVLTYEDDNPVVGEVTVTDNGSKLSLKWERIESSNKYQATYTATQEGPHTIKITAKDDAGNDAIAKQIVFVKDTVAPTITAVLNGGMVYTESMGEVDLTSAATLNFSVSDKNDDVEDFHYQLVKTVPDTLPVTADYIKTNNRTFGFADEADYLVNVYTIDKAGNRGLARSVNFRVDTTAPELKISGAASGSSLNTGTTLTFTMTEAFWKDASGTVTITRKAGDGASEATYKTIDFKPTARTTNVSESLTETGEYKVTFTAKDRAGHTSEAAAYTVKIDKDKPVITLNGVANNDKTTGEVEFMAQIEDDFYLTKAISINATRTYLDETTNKEKTEDIKFTGYNAAASDTIIRNTFKDDGIYRIQITCKDAAGNEDVQEVSFTIDKSKPVIDSKVLGAYEGTLTAFAWDYDINDLVYDLTVCDVHMYLNGSEYDGTSEIEDGAYEMKITAEDELGNYVEQIVNFTLDTKAPTFIVTGVEDGEMKNEQYTIEISLQLDEDVLDSVSLNGSAVEVKDNKASLTVSEKGDYELTMKAHDAAGNEAEKTIHFTYGEKSTWWIYLIIGVAAVLVIGGIIFVVVRRKNDK